MFSLSISSGLELISLSSPPLKLSVRVKVTLCSARHHSCPAQPSCLWSFLWDHCVHTSLLFFFSFRTVVSWKSNPLTKLFKQWLNCAFPQSPWTGSLYSACLAQFWGWLWAFHQLASEGRGFGAPEAYRAYIFSWHIASGFAGYQRPPPSLMLSLQKGLEKHRIPLRWKDPLVPLSSSNRSCRSQSRDMEQCRWLEPAEMQCHYWTADIGK